MISYMALLVIYIFFYFLSSILVGVIPFTLGPNSVRLFSLSPKLRNVCI